MSTLTSELTGFQAQFDAVKTDAAQLVKGLTEVQFNWRPDLRTWSIAECLQHLNIVADRYVHVLETIIADARARGIVGQGPFGYGRLGKWILTHTEPPPKRRYGTPRAFTPVHGQPVTAVMPTFLHLQEQLILAWSKPKASIWRA